jgi:hypothetical protein
MKKKPTKRAKSPIPKELRSVQKSVANLTFYTTSLDKCTGYEEIML